MDNFEKHGLDDDAFGEKSTIAGLKTFDAFPKTKPSYTSATSAGGKWTVALIIFCTLLTITELRTWFRGTETHHFSVEQGVSHELQLNLDIVVAMQCKDLHVNVQDAAMDRILAGDLLKREDTNWQVWVDKAPSGTKKGYRKKAGENYYRRLHENDLRRRRAEEEDQHVSHVLGHMREGARKFMRSPRLRASSPRDACRIYGSLEGNKVQGDFHITARGHGYMDFGGPTHLDHGTFNFSHHVNELSFGPHYPNLLNPLDKTSETTNDNFYKYQYYVSIVPTIFTKRRVSTRSGSLDPAAIPQPPTLDQQPSTTRDKDGRIIHVEHPQRGADSQSIFTNQYAATSQSHPIAPNTIPGIFFKYDFEPILLIVSEQRGPFLTLVVRLVNVISGVLVGGGWIYLLSVWAGDVVGRRRRASMGGMNGSILHT